MWACCCFAGDAQVETKGCLEAIDDVLAVPGITCAFLGECHHAAKKRSLLALS
jgi:2-keto-3-deoxy-L-rhamnonate aldolase RhmA